MLRLFNVIFVTSCRVCPQLILGEGVAGDDGRARPSHSECTLCVPWGVSTVYSEVKNGSCEVLHGILLLQSNKEPRSTCTGRNVCDLLRLGGPVVGTDGDHRVGGPEWLSEMCGDCRNGSPRRDLCWPGDPDRARAQEASSNS